MVEFTRCFGARTMRGVAQHPPQSLRTPPQVCRHSGEELDPVARSLPGGLRQPSTGGALVNLRSSDGPPSWPLLEPPRGRQHPPGFGRVCGPARAFPGELRAVITTATGCGRCRLDFRHAPSPPCPLPPSPGHRPPPPLPSSARSSPNRTRGRERRISAGRHHHRRPGAGVGQASSLVPAEPSDAAAL